MPLFGASGSRIGYEVHDGPADAPPLLLLHGFTASSACWIENLPGLRERFTVITADLLGHGNSDSPEDPALYRPEAAVERIAGLIGHLGYTRVLICGHSLGGALALRFALDRPDLVDGLVVLNSNSAAGTPAWRDAAREGMAAMAGKARLEGTEFLRETRLYPARGRRLPLRARELLTRDFERMSPAAFAGTAESLVIDVNSFERLPGLTRPVLVMIGDQDSDFVQSAPDFIARMPSDLVDTFTIEGGGHAANLEQPALFNEALFAFAERLGYLAPDGEEGDDEAPRGPGLLGAGPETGDLEDPTDEDLGPTLYQELGESLRTGGRQTALTAAGFGLIAVGAALLVSAFFVGRSGDGDGNVIASADRETPTAAATATPTIVEQSAGIRTAAPATSTTAAATPTEATPVPPTPTATAVEAADPEAPEEDEEDPSTPAPEETPTPEPSPAATATPTGPWVAINGPASAGVGETVTFAASESDGALRRDWIASNGATSAHAAAFTVSFASAGCHAVTLTALFPDGPRSTTVVVAVGVESCPGG